MLHIGRKPGDPFKRGLTLSRFTGEHSRQFRATWTTRQSRNSVMAVFGLDWSFRWIEHWRTDHLTPVSGSIGSA